MEQLSLIQEPVVIDVNRKKLPVILSASRMTDMPKYYPNDLINEVESRLKKGIDIHTLVLWTKHPDSLLTNLMSEFLGKLVNLRIQIYLQCTITGMGQKVIGTTKDGKPLIMEPNASHPEKALTALKDIINHIGSPLRIRVRIDPLIRIVDDKSNEIFSNLSCVKYIVSYASRIGINNFSVSFLEKGMHKKVDKRFDELGWSILAPTIEERIKASNWLNEIAKMYGVNIYACSVPGLPESRCIDGYLLQKLHPDNRPTILEEPRKRKLCACTHSIDIGGWPPKKCYTGCQYCYANSSFE